MTVPEVLLGGNHAEIAKWRLEQRKQRTKQRRPDLWRAYLQKRSDGLADK
jgi:tRNA (guanine37-N1)-methyltransferase